MSLADSIIVAIIEKLLIGVVILVAGFWLNERLETVKAGRASFPVRWTAGSRCSH
jgi:hypothetical protein